MTPDHLKPTLSARGFARLPVIEGTVGERVRVYESSSASGPHLWLAIAEPTDRNTPGGLRFQAHAHLPVEQARKYAEQILHLIDNHYQAGEIQS